MRILHDSIPILALVMLTTPIVVASEPTQADRARSWSKDLDQLTRTLEAVHPDLYARVDRDQFQAAASSIRAELPTLSDRQVALRMMQLVASVEDGHTSLEPVDPHGFERWFPVRFYRFRDGIFITAVAETHRELAGRQVLRIGERSSEVAWDLAGTLLGADNELGREHRAPFYLSNAGALEALGVTPAGEPLRIEVVTADGGIETVTLESIDSGHDLSFQFWGEIWGPASEEVTYVTPFGLSDDHFDEGSELPLHLRYRSAYWWTFVEEEGMFYVQINFMGNSQRRGETFAEFSQSVWNAVDELSPDRFVLDIRYNIGGDGSLVLPFVHEIIKRDSINRKGALFTIVGRATYSAGVMFARAMEEHTATTFVGEPPGGYWAHYGDATSFELAESGLVVWVSTIYHQLSSYAGDRRLLEIELPATFSSTQYLTGADPALDAIRGADQRPLVANVFREKGGKAGLAEYEKRLAEYGGVSWYAPFSLSQLNSLGHELLDAGRYEDALAAYRLNTRRHPEHWRVWYSLARAQKRHGDVDEAIANYERALAADPFNNLAPYQRDALAELRAASSSAP